MAQVFFDLTDLPVDFGTMNTATITVRTRGVDMGASPVKLYAQLFRSDETTELSNEVECVTVSTDGSFADVGPVTFTGLDIASGKAVWDNARVRFRWASD